MEKRTKDIRRISRILKEELVPAMGLYGADSAGLLCRKGQGNTGLHAGQRAGGSKW